MKRRKSEVLGPTVNGEKKQSDRPLVVQKETQGVRCRKMTKLDSQLHGSLQNS